MNPFDAETPRSQEAERIRREDETDDSLLSAGQLKAKRARFYKREERRKKQEAKQNAARVLAEKKLADSVALESEYHVVRLAMELQGYLWPNLDGTPSVLDEEDIQILREEVIPDVEQVVQRGLGLGGDPDHRRKPIELWRKYGCMSLPLVKDFQRFVEATLGTGLMPITEREIKSIEHWDAKFLEVMKSCFPGRTVVTTTELREAMQKMKAQCHTN